jgi:Mg-chelatase subunit ChlD
MKGKQDGEDRDARSLNVLICLDISGSMGGGLGSIDYSHHTSRLDLSKEAIKMFISKLRPNDAIGMITFNDKAQVIFEVTLKS